MIGQAGCQLKPHLPALSSQKNEMLIFVLCSTFDDQPVWSIDSNPIHHLPSAKKWNAHFCITFNIWLLAGLINGLESHLPPLSSQDNEMPILYYVELLMNSQVGPWPRIPFTTSLQPK